MAAKRTTLCGSRSAEYAWRNKMAEAPAATAAADSDRSAGLTPGMFSSIRHHARDADLRRQGGTGEAPGRGRHSPGSSPVPSCSSALYPFWCLGAEAPAAAAPSRATPLRRLHTGVVGLVDAAVQNPAAGGDGSIESGGFGRGGAGRPWCSCFRSSADGFVTVWNHAGGDRESATHPASPRPCRTAGSVLGRRLVAAPKRRSGSPKARRGRRARHGDVLVVALAAGEPKLERAERAGVGRPRVPGRRERGARPGPSRRDGPSGASTRPSPRASGALPQGLMSPEMLTLASPDARSCHLISRAAVGISADGCRPDEERER